jgi:hypothetical protein
LLIRDTLYGSKERVVWMDSLRRLLKLGCPKILLFLAGLIYLQRLKGQMTFANY